MSFRVSSSPLPGRQKCSRPNATLGGLRLVLLRAVILDAAGRHRPTMPYDPGIHVGAVRDRTDRKDPIISVAPLGGAGHYPIADIAAQLLRRRLSAGPCLPFGIDACLTPFWSVDALQANARTGYFDAVAVNHSRPADQRRLGLGGPMLVSVEAEQAGQQDDGNERTPIDPTGYAPSSSWSVRH